MPDVGRNWIRTTIWLAIPTRQYSEIPEHGSDKETIRLELKKAIELAPQFVEATEMLASENLARNLEIGETIE